MMEGGPSHIDTFDPKPKLAELHLKEFTRDGQDAVGHGERQAVLRRRARSSSARRASAGPTSPTNWEHLAGVADDLCFYRGCQVDSVNHPTAMYQMNTGNRFGGDPAVGSWVTYGLGTREPEPAGVRRAAGGDLSAGRRRQLGQRLPAGPLPGHAAAAEGLADPRPAPAGRRHARAPAGEPRPARRAERRRTRAQHPRHDDLAARMESYELAFRMQAEVPGLLDLDEGGRARRWRCTASAAEPTDAFGRRCLLARRLVRAGRALRAALRRHLGLARLHRAGPRQPGAAGRSADRRADRRPEAARPAGRARSSSGAASSAARRTTASAAARPSAATTTARR